MLLLEKSETAAFLIYFVKKKRKNRNASYLFPCRMHTVIAASINLDASNIFVTQINEQRKFKAIRPNIIGNNL